MEDLAGDAIRIEVGPRTTNQYGRMLAYVGKKALRMRS